ncbi:MAG: Gfo/Idh/MocA family oxidoreductase [Phycisphaerae bacterium]|nr:Gfo/Idh/MocA family oxidoreductase [Phycisphaerae bacterium]
MTTPLPRIPRRQFLRRAVAAATLLPVACASAPKPKRYAANEKLRLGVIGVANQGGSNLNAVASEDIVALCDVDRDYLAAASSQFPNARSFVDFRELLTDDSLGLDGVVISTPDHTHAPATVMALKRRLAVYCEKPLTHTVEECRTLQNLAAKHRCVTQMGTIIHAEPNYRRVVEAIRAGVIGPITQVDCWCPKSWCCAKPTPGAVPPERLNWPLWQGPIPDAPYVEGIAPANWRGHWSYGTGTLGDMGCHILDLPFWALDLAGPKGDRMIVAADGPPVDAMGCPEWLEATWVFPNAAPPKGDPLIVRWFDGGRIPPTVQEIGAKDRQDYFGRYMVCFQGTHGFLLANYGEMKILMVPDAVLPEPTIPASPGHHREWLDAIRSGADTGDGAPLCRFEYSAPLTEMVLLGTVAYRSRSQITWDRPLPVLANDPALKPWLTERYRDGWSLT